MTHHKRAVDLGRFQIEVMLALWRIGGVGRLRDVVGELSKKRPGLAGGGVYTTFMRLSLLGLVAKRNEGDRAEYALKEGAYAEIGEWMAGVKALIDEHAVLSDVENPFA